MRPRLLPLALLLCAAVASAQYSLAATFDLGVGLSEGRLGLFRQKLAEQAMKGKSAQDKRAFIAFLKDNDLASERPCWDSTPLSSVIRVCPNWWPPIWAGCGSRSPAAVPIRPSWTPCGDSCSGPVPARTVFQNQGHVGGATAGLNVSLSYDHDALAQDGLFNDDPASRRRSRWPSYRGKQTASILSKLDLK